MDNRSALQRESLNRRSALTAIAGAVAWPGTVSAQSYPTQTIRILVPFAAGGGGDSLAQQYANLNQATKKKKKKKKKRNITYCYESGRFFKRAKHRQHQHGDSLVNQIIDFIA